MAAAQAAAGHSTAVFAPSPAEPGKAFAAQFPRLEEGVRVYRVPVGKRSRTQVFLQTFGQSELRRAWGEVLDLEQPDLVHVEHFMGLPLELAAELTRRAIPYVVTLHDYWYICANAQLLTNTDQTICPGPDGQALNCARCAAARSGYPLGGAAAPLLAPLMKRRNGRSAAVLNKSGGIIAPTRFVRDCYQSLLPAAMRIDVLPHGIAYPQLARERRSKQMPDGRLRVGYIGSIAWQKGVHVLVSAVNSLPEEEVSLMLFGDLDLFPDYARHLRQLITRPGIELAGIVDRDQLWSAISGFDVVVLPTLWYETSVLVIDEVNALGVPIIGSDIGVMKEKIADGRNGRLFPVGDARALGAVLREIVERPETLDIWRRYIDPVFTLEDHIRGLEEIYARAVNPV